MINVEFTNEINDIITENLYQWDTYQILKISGIDFGSVSPRVHFANKKSQEALVIEAVLKADGSIEASIPNSLLTEKYDILAYIYTNTGLTSKTIKSITIPIIPRLKPSEYYQPTDENIAEIEAIELEAKNIIDNLYGSEYNSTKKYKRPNIVYYNYSAYMCKSSSGVTGVNPTDTTNWVKITEGAVVTKISKDSIGNLMFIFSNGTTITVEMAVKDVALIDDGDIPCLALTSSDVNKIKNAHALSLSYAQVQNCKKIKALEIVPKDASSDCYSPNLPGLYSIIVKDKITNYNHPLVMSIPKATGQVYYSTPLTNSSGSYYVKYTLVNSDLGRYGFEISNSSMGEILDVKTLIEYTV